MKKILKIISFVTFFMVSISSISYGQATIEKAEFYWYENGTMVSQVFQAGDQKTVYRDPGSQIDVRIYRTSISGTSSFNVFDFNNSKTFNKETSASYWFFGDISGSNETEIWVNVNSNVGTIRLTFKNRVGTPDTPNLYVSNITVNNTATPESYEVGETVDIDLIVWNGGSGEASSSSVGYYIGNTKDDISERFQSDGVRSLASKAGSNESESYTFTNSDVGTRYLVFKADYKNEVSESNEDDNVAFYGPFTVVEKPKELTLEVSPSIVISKNQGENYSYTITVKDQDGNLVDGASISILDNVLSSSQSRTTDNGVATYSGTVPEAMGEGSYNIDFIATKSGFKSSGTIVRKIIVENREASEIVFLNNSWSVQNNGLLQIEGKVVDQSGNGIAGISLGVEDPFKRASFVDVAITNSDGTFSYTADPQTFNDEGIYTFVFYLSYEDVFPVNVLLKDSIEDQVMYYANNVVSNFGAIAKDAAMFNYLGVLTHVAPNSILIKAKEDIEGKAYQIALDVMPHFLEFSEDYAKAIFSDPTTYLAIGAGIACPLTHGATCPIAITLAKKSLTKNAYITVTKTGIKNLPVEESVKENLDFLVDTGTFLYSFMTIGDTGNIITDIDNYTGILVSSYKLEKNRDGKTIKSAIITLTTDQGIVNVLMVNTSPGVPTNLSPLKGALLSSKTPEFSWGEFNSGGDKNTQAGYQFRVVDESDNDRRVYDTGFISSSEATSHTYSAGSYTGKDEVTGDEKISEDLIAGHTYHWHVRVRDSGGDWSDWSADVEGEYQTFTLQSDPTESFSTSIVTSSEISIGEEFDVDINIGSSSDPLTDLFGVSFVLGYPSDKVEVISNSPGDFLGSDLTYFPFDEPDKNQIAFGISRKNGVAGVSGSGTVAKVRFKVKESITQESSFSLNLTELTANDPNGNPIQLEESSAIINITMGTCVWPGDTNNNGIVNQADIPPIGLHWGKTGDPRGSTSIIWECKTGNNKTWTPENAVYADANGDGKIDQGDIPAIGLNWGKEQSQQSLKTAISSPMNMVIAANETTNPPLSVLSESSISVEQDFTVSVIAGSSENPVSDLHGASFVINFDTEYLEYISNAQGDFLGSDIIYFPTPNTENGELAIGMSKKGGSGNDGSGILSSVTFKLLKAIPKDVEVSILLTELAFNNSTGAPITLDPVSFNLESPKSKLTLSIPDSTGQKGKSLTLPLSLLNNEGVAFSSYQFELSFDPAQVDITNVTNGNVFDSLIPEFNSPSSGEMLISGASSEDATKDGVLVYLDIDLLDGGETEISFSQADFNEGAFDFTFVNSTLSISTILCGDATGNGTISADDAAEILKHTVKKLTITGDEAKASDVTSNGSISAYDASMILKYKANQDVVLNCDGEVDQLAKTQFASAEAKLLFDGNSTYSTSISVPIDIDVNSGEVYSFESAIKLPDGVKFNRLSSSISGLSTLANVKDQTLYISAFSGKALNGVIGEIELDIIETESNISLSGSYKINENSESTFNNINVFDKPEAFSLSQNYPNPFNPTTNLEFTVPDQSEVKILVFNMLGQQVAELVNGTVQAGKHTVTWDASEMSSGIYVYRLISGSQTITNKMMLIK